MSRSKWRYLHLWKCRWQSQKWPEAKQCQAKKTAKCAEPTAIRAMKEAGSERDREREKERKKRERSTARQAKQDVYCLFKSLSPFSSSPPFLHPASIESAVRFRAPKSMQRKLPVNFCLLLHVERSNFCCLNSAGGAASAVAAASALACRPRHKPAPLPTSRTPPPLVPPSTANSIEAFAIFFCLVFAAFSRYNFLFYCCI